MEDFRPGDFVRLKDIGKWNTGRIIHKTVNVFEVIEVGDRYVKIKNNEVRISLTEIEPIPIDGICDRSTYYDPIIAAEFVREGDPIPIKHRDKSYYYDSFSNCFYKEKSFQQLTKEKNCLYVHEIQHFLYDHFKDQGLKINAW